MRLNLTMRWAIQDSLWKLNVGTPFEVVKEYRKMTLEGIVGQIKCPTLVCDSENEMFMGGQSRVLFNHLSCPKELMLFTAEEGADEHCQDGAKLLSHQRIIDWLDKVLFWNA